ncbi:hypothetical protein NOVOSPHI9U_620015 [Novosphingobium sp. 9U]|nr:hypothetical protein NOVOSPHI9U_620015 [Novosphingobium sp. 9U]
MIGRQRWGVPRCDVRSRQHPTQDLSFNRSPGNGRKVPLYVVPPGGAGLPDEGRGPREQMAEVEEQKRASEWPLMGLLETAAGEGGYPSFPLHSGLAHERTSLAL